MTEQSTISHPSDCSSGARGSENIDEQIARLHGEIEQLGTARALRRCGYHRTDPGRYGAALRSLYREAVIRWPVQVRRARRVHVRPTLYARHEETNR